MKKGILEALVEIAKVRARVDGDLADNCQKAIELIINFLAKEIEDYADTT